MPQLGPNLARFGARGSLNTLGWHWFEPLFIWLGASLVIAFVHRRSVDWRVATVGAITFVACTGQLIASWLVMPLELERYGVPANILIRVAPLIVIANAFGADFGYPAESQPTNRE